MKKKASYLSIFILFTFLAYGLASCEESGQVDSAKNNISGSDSDSDTDSDTDADSDSDSDSDSDGDKKNNNKDDKTNDDTDKSSDTDEDDATDEEDTEIPEPECDKKGGSTGDKCSEEELCNCKNMCGYQIISENAGDVPSAYYCYERCDPDDVQCSGSTDICYEVPKRQPVCVPTGTFKADEWQMKIFQGATPNAENGGYVEGLNIKAKMAGDALPSDNFSAGGMGKRGNVTLAFSLYKQFEEEGVAMTDLWTLTVTIPEAKWKKGTLKAKTLVDKDVLEGFQAALTHITYPDETPADARGWTEGVAMSGELTITKVVEPCTDAAECNEMAEGSINIKILGTKYEIVPEMFQKDTDSTDTDT